MKKSTIKTFLTLRNVSFLCLFFNALIANAQQESLTLSVAVFGAESNKGQALFSLFDSAESFLNEPTAYLEQSNNESGDAVFVLSDLPPGVYAFTVIYDEDNNGKLNTGFFGIPKEKVGVSNNPKARLGPPKFKDAAFTLSTSTTLRISLEEIN